MINNNEQSILSIKNEFKNLENKISEQLYKNNKNVQDKMDQILLQLNQQ